MSGAKHNTKRFRVPLSLKRFSINPRDQRELRWFFQKGPKPKGLTPYEHRKWDSINRALNGRGYRLFLYFKYGGEMSAAITDERDLSNASPFSLLGWEAYEDWRKTLCKPGGLLAWRTLLESARTLNDVAEDMLSDEQYRALEFGALADHVAPHLRREYVHFIGRKISVSNQRMRGRPRAGAMPPAARYITIAPEKLSWAMPSTVGIFKYSNTWSSADRWGVKDKQSAWELLLSFIHGGHHRDPHAYGGLTRQAPFVCDWSTFGDVRVDSNGAHFFATKFLAAVPIAGLANDQILEAIEKYIDATYDRYSSAIKAQEPRSIKDWPTEPKEVSEVSAKMTLAEREDLYESIKDRVAYVDDNGVSHSLKLPDLMWDPADNEQHVGRDFTTVTELATQTGLPNLRIRGFLAMYYGSELLKRDEIRLEWLKSEDAKRFWVDVAAEVKTSTKRRNRRNFAFKSKSKLPK